MREASGERNEERGNWDEAGRESDDEKETRRLRSKEMGNVVAGQRKMAEILTSRG